MTCSGTTTGGYVLTSDQSPLTVSAGASLQNSAGDALTVAIPANAFYDPRTVTLTINGSVSSATGNGISVYSGPFDGGDYDFYGTSGTITVGAGGSISGVTGITIAQSPGYFSQNAPVHISIDNFGTITGTGGVALSGVDSLFYNNISYSTITNEIGGSIGAIDANFGTLSNSGTIDGGTLSAVRADFNNYYATVNNAGTITASGAADTVTNANATYYSGALTNSGTITNTGTGAAISGFAIITNQAGGTISASGSDVIAQGLAGALTVTNGGTIGNLGAGQAISGAYVNVTNNAGGAINAGSGGVAINAASSLTLVNMGTINGNVLAGNAGYVDSSQGTINGNLVFGATTTR